MQTDKLRSLYIDYFKAKDHKVFSSASLIPGDDPTLLFTGAGMNQFKANFMGIKKEPKRATSCQKCVRTADLVRVGETAYHHTFFEMLGNFSFGDYFKEEAIQYAWDFITRELKMSKDDLWVTVFHEDHEARDIWHRKRHKRLAHERRAHVPVSHGWRVVDFSNPAKSTTLKLPRQRAAVLTLAWRAR